MRLKPLNINSCSICTEFQIIKIENTEDAFIKNHSALNSLHYNTNGIYVSQANNIPNNLQICSTFIEECNTKNNFDYKEKGTYIVNRYTDMLYMRLFIYPQSYFEIDYDSSFKIYLYFSFYLLFKYKDEKVAKNISRMILERFDNIFSPLNNFEDLNRPHLYTFDIVTASVFLLPYILANQLYSNKIDFRNRKNYDNVIKLYNNIKQVFSLTNKTLFNIMTPSNLLQEYNRTVNIKKDFGLLETPKRNFYEFINYTVLLYLSIEYEILKQLDNSISENLFNTYKTIHQIVYHQTIASLPLKIFISTKTNNLVQNTYVSSETLIDDNFGIKIIPSIKFLRYFSTDINFSVQGFNFEPFDIYNGTSYDKFTVPIENNNLAYNSYYYDMNNINNIGRIFLSKDKQPDSFIKFTTNIYDSFTFPNNCCSVIDLLSNCVFQLNEDVAISYINGLVLDVVKDITLNEIIIIENGIITIYREIINNSDSNVHQLYLEPSDTNFNIPSNNAYQLGFNDTVFCKYIFNTETLEYTYEQTIFDFETLKIYTLNGDSYKFNNFTNNGNVIISKNSEPYVLCPNYYLANNDIITEINESNELLSFKYSETYNQWYKIN